MKNAIITGSSKGLGKSIATALAEEGYNLWLSARSEKELQGTAAEIKKEHAVDIKTHRVNFGDTEAVSNYAALLAKECPSVDVLVNNVGTYQPDSVEDGLSHLEAQLSINFSSAVAVTQALVPTFIKQKNGHIFTICSVVNRQPRASAASYTISKFALHAYHKVLHSSLLPHWVKVTAFFPSSINTSSWEGSDAPLDDFVQPDDIASLITTILRMKRGTVPSEIDLGSINPAF
jgi:3-oxoacyl-[acyl-carrier protein] reductase